MSFAVMRHQVGLQKHHLSLTSNILRRSNLKHSKSQSGRCCTQAAPIQIFFKTAAVTLHGVPQLITNFLLSAATCAELEDLARKAEAQSVFIIRGCLISQGVLSPQFISLTFVTFVRKRVLSQTI